MAKKKLASPNWEHWRRIKETSLANALLLSQNICPENHILGSTPQDFGKIVNNNIHEILQTALNWVPNQDAKWVIDKGPFSPREINLILVDLPAFAQWTSQYLPQNIKSGEFTSLPKLLDIETKKKRNQKWTVKEVKEMTAFKEKHGTALTAKNYGITTDRVRKIIKSIENTPELGRAWINKIK